MQLRNGSQEKIYLDLCHLLRGADDSIAWSSYDSRSWLAFYHRAVGEGVGPWLYHYFEARGWPPECPQQVQVLFMQVYYNSLAAHLLWQQEAQSLLTAFGEQGIEVVALKGLDLAYSLYSEPALRPMGDLDFLIRASDLQAATMLVKDHGYQLEDELRSIPASLRWLVTYEANFDKLQPTHVHLELHWNLIGSSCSQLQPEIDWFWAQRLHRQMGTQAVPGLTPTAQFLYAAAHLGIKHSDRETRLIWYYDLYLLLQRFCAQIDWRELFSRARQFGWQPGLSRVLKGLASCFAINLPDLLPGELQPVLMEILSEPNYQPTAQAATRWQGVNKKLNAYGWRIRVQWILWLLCPNPAYLRWRYRLRNAWLIPFYYPYRWLDILGDGLATLYHKLIPVTKLER